MQRKLNMTASEAANYLQSEIKNSVILDVGSCLNSSNPKGGVFAVPRLVLAYVDYLGALYHGYDGSVDPRTGRRIFSKTSYAKSFLVEVFGTVHDDYKRYGELLYDIYRHGTVHLYEPLTLKNRTTGKTIEWHVFKLATPTAPPSRVGEIKTNPWNRMMIHLVPTPKPGQNDPNVWVLPVSIDCLYFDLLAALDVYAKRVQNEPDLAGRFQRTINALMSPDETDLVWP
jgi:hypothetical protein